MCRNILGPISNKPLARTWLLAAALVVSMVLIPLGQAMAKTPIRVAIPTAEDDPTGIAALHFRDRLLELAGDDVAVRIFTRGTLGSETAAMEGTIGGDIDVLAISNTVLANLVPELQVLDIPFGLTSPDHAWRVLDGPIGDSLNTKLEARGLRVKGWAYAGSRCLMFRNQLVETPSDIRGMKVRVPANPVYAETVEAWGASATTVDWPEVYLALAQGVVDGIETAPGPSFDQKHFEVAKYLVRTNHLVYFHGWVVSDRSWQSWSPRVRDAVAVAASEAALLNRQLRLEQEQGIFRRFEENGVTVVVPESGLFAQSVASVVEKHGRTHADLLREIAAYQ